MKLIIQNINMEKIIKEINGISGYVKPKSIVSITRLYLSITGENKKDAAVVEQEEFINPAVKIYLNDDYTQLDIKFKSSKDHYLDSLWELLINHTAEFSERYITKDISLNEDDDDMKLVFKIMPAKCTGNHFFLGVNPIFYTLHSSDTSKTPNIIRVVFDHENVFCINSF